jgi:hypothetical protein
MKGAGGGCIQIGRIPSQCTAITDRGEVVEGSNERNIGDQEKDTFLNND